MLEAQLEELRRATLAAFASAVSLEELEEARVEALGRKGTLAQISKEFGKLAPDGRARLGKLLNSVKDDLETAYEDKKTRFDKAELAERLAKEWIDVTLPAPGVRPGSLHPVTQLQNEIEDLFTSLGFAVLYGPEVETEEHNFDALNIPPTHPVRGMRTLGPPLRMIAPGRAFRNEEVDASHEHTFYQLEGMMIDRDVSVANLIYFMKTLLTEVFKREVTVRLRPGYFPFVEPGFELDIQCLICDGAGCPVCKHSGWVELLPCGLVHPNVLKLSGIDPEEWGGFAFGLGLTRLAM